MAGKNSNEGEFSRGDATDHLREITDNLDAGGEFDIANKTMSLRPSSAIDFEVGTRESSSILRGSCESVTIKTDWKPE